MQTATIDPYSFAAGRLPTDTREAIRGFWSHFAANAEGLDRCFTSKMTDMTTKPTDVMQSLSAVSPELMWEFGPSDQGHTLMITAEWRDENRALARMVNEMAPDLPRWEFREVRSRESDARLTADYFAQRFGEPLLLTKIDAILGETGRIDLVGHGPGSEQALADQALKVASAVLGEEVERDWVGFIDGAPETTSGLLGRFRKKTHASFDAAAFADSFRCAIAQSKSAMPKRPYAATPIDEREVTLFKPNNMHPKHPRADLLTYTAASETYGRAVLSRARFSSRCHSQHDEWFLCLRIRRTSEAPFDEVAERGAIEDRLHDVLSKDGLGGTVAAGHGSNAIYIDLAATHVGQAVEQIGDTLRGETYAEAATLHFLDQGLHSLVLPAAPDLTKLN